MIDLSTAKNPCVFLSGGIDSMLVLAMAREIMPDISIYCFNQNFTKEQWSILEYLIKMWDLEVNSFPPMNTYLVPNGKTLAQVSEYNLNGVVIPILRDFIDGPRCSLTLDKKRLESHPFAHDVVLVGCRKADTSFATGSPFCSQEVVLGNITFYAPLFDWTHDEVMAEAKKRDLPFAAEFYVAGDDDYDTGNVKACVRCMDSDEAMVFCPKDQIQIPTFQWDKNSALINFRNKFGFIGA